MNSTECPASLIDLLGAAPRTTETVATLKIARNVDADRVEAVIRAVEAFRAAKGWSVSLRDAEYEEISPEGVAVGELHLTVGKPVGGRVFFATLDGFRDHLRDPALSAASEVLVLTIGTSSPFSTRRFRVEPWDGTPMDGLPPVTPDPANEPGDPRRGLVRDLTGAEVPEDPLRWLPLAPHGAGTVWEAWRGEAAKRLALLFATEVWSEGGKLMVRLNGARKRDFEFDAEMLGEGAFPRIAEAAEWLVMERGADARHEMFTRRLAAVMPEGTSWCGALPGHLPEALEGARIDFRAYARSKSAETLKAMADLRKAVGDDVGRIVERTQRLSNGFVASIVALAAGLGLRLALTAAKGDATGAAIVLGIVVLAVMWAGVLLQRNVSGKSLRDDLRNMRKWHRSVHVALSGKEYRELAVKPIRDAVRLYKVTASQTIWGLYAASAIFFLILIFMPSIKGQ
ncbi:MAG: hypothetical protein H7Z12_15280 [Rhodospirillaceae bacterium]|nr:hypothetical protein [Rhodospirillales bacterium]